MKQLLVIAFAFASTAALAQVWTELGDAPEGVPAHQETMGVGALTLIEGGISRGTGDHTDTYCITITDPGTFFASTKISMGGYALTATGGFGDTRMWLWNMNGGLLLANDDHAGGTDGLKSTITDPSTFVATTGAFGTAGTVAATATPISLTPGQYLLSISYFPNDPDDAVGVDQATIGSPFTALHGKNPASGAFDHWENAAGTTAWTYGIALRGASYCVVPEPATIVALGIGALGLLVARRRKG